MNGYVYSDDNPVTFSDPSGLMMGAGCGPDGVLCGGSQAVADPNQVDNRAYWMHKVGNSDAMVK
jgi:hypothetical protein